MGFSMPHRAHRLVLFGFIEHAFYRLRVQETTTSAREFGQRLLIHQRPKREQLVSRDTRVLMRKVISSLPPAQQQAIDLAFFRGMSQREIAAKTNTPLGTVKTRLELGLKKIYDDLKELRDEL